MVINLWKYIRGYVRVYVSGYSPERFINLCANRNIYLWDIKPVKDGYIFSVSKKGFFMLRPVAKKTKSRVRIEEKVGLVFKSKKNRNSNLLLNLMFICLGIILALSVFVWKIDITGNVKYTDDKIMKKLIEYNIHIGKCKYFVKCDDIEQLIYNEFEHVKWVGCKLEGTNLSVEIREKEEISIPTKDTKICDIISDKKGKIHSIVARQGTPLVKKGDEVEVNDLLISGNLETYEYNQLLYVNFAHADGDIFIEREISYSDGILKKNVQKKYLKDKQYNKFGLDIFNKKIMFPRMYKRKKNEEIVLEKKQVELIENFYLPIYFYKEIHQPYLQVEKEYSKDEIMLILEKNLSKEIEKMKKNDIQILGINVVYSQDVIKSYAKGSLKIIEKVGVVHYFDEEVRRKEYNEYFPDENGDTP